MNRPKINIKDVFNLSGSAILNPDKYISTSYVSTDSRNIRKGSIFVAIQGEKFDGHNFVMQAIEKGASTIVINENRLNFFDNVDIPIVTVPDTTKAYGEIALAYRRKLKAKVIAITGSNGKTTTKEILTSLLSKKYKVEKTLANNNNHIGVPLTILSTDGNTDILVLELGTNHFGEIAYTSEVAEADYALITNIGHSHLEFLKNLDGVAEEKSALLEKTSRNGGKVFINNDDKYLRNRAQRYANKVTFGFSDNSDIRGEIKGYSDNGGAIVSFKTPHTGFESEISLPGESNAKNYLAAVAVALELGMSGEEIQAGSGNIKSVEERLNVITKERFILINDTYNANPESMKTAFEFLKNFGAGRKKIAILGDMFELGNDSERVHKQLAQEVISNGLDEVYVIGDMMKYMIEELHSEKIKARYFSDRTSLAKFLSELNIQDSIILFKGSRGMKMEEFIGSIVSI